MKTEKKIKIITNIGLGICIAGLALLFVGMIFSEDMIPQTVKYVLSGVGGGVFVIGVAVNFAVPALMRKRFNSSVLEKGVRTPAILTALEILSENKRDKEYKLTFLPEDGSGLSVISYKVYGLADGVAPSRGERWEISYHKDELCAVMIKLLEKAPENYEELIKAAEPVKQSKPNLGIKPNPHKKKK